MTHHRPLSSDPVATEPGRQLAQLHELMVLVDRIAGHGETSDPDALARAARLAEKYGESLPLVQRRFDALAAETATWAAAGVEALLGARGDVPPRPAASRLAQRLRSALLELDGLIGAH